MMPGERQPERDAEHAPRGRGTRRAFLESSVFLGGALLFGCSGKKDDGSGGDWGCANPLDGDQLGTVPFVNEGDPLLEQPVDAGLDGRLYTNLSTLTPETLVLPNDRFYVRTRYPDLLAPPNPWTILVNGLVDGQTLVLSDLLAIEQPLGVHLLECSGNVNAAHFGMLSACAWSGIPIRDVLDRLTMRPGATRVLVSGFDQYSTPSMGGRSTPGASWIFKFEDLAVAGAFLATKTNDLPLSPDHGAPVRLVVPGWYGCACIKWVDQISIVGEDEPATSQMMEFASRTGQRGVPAMARDYLPATIDQAAMPVRVEKWRIAGRITYRVVGILWGGSKPTDALSVAFGDGAFEHVDLCPRMSTNSTWTLWSHRWRPTRTGSYPIRCRIDDPQIRTRRLDTGYYAREVVIDQV